MKRSVFYSILAGAGLMSCSLHFTSSVTAERLPVTNQQAADETAGSMVSGIAPYKSILDSCMNRKVNYCWVDLEHFKGRSPMALVLLQQMEVVAREQLPGIGSDQVMTIVNTGGIRSGLQKGEVTVGEIYNILPFDNRLVFLKLTEMEQEAVLQQNRANPKLLFWGDTLIGDADEYTWLVVSDFIMNGGDHFQLPATVDRSKLMNSGLIRDLVLERFSKIDTLKPVR